MNAPENLKYSETHEWVEFTDESTARIGLSDFAQYSLGDIVYVSLPIVGDAVSAEKCFGEIESVKTAMDLISPVSGIVLAVNESVAESPENINNFPYETWLVEVTDITSQTKLMDASEYKVNFKEKE